MRNKIRSFTELIRTPFKKDRIDEDSDPTRFIGKKVMARTSMNGPDELITIESVCGIKDATYPDHRLALWLQINGTHMCPILSYFTQLMEHRMPTEEEVADMLLIGTSIKQIKEIK